MKFNLKINNREIIFFEEVLQVAIKKAERKATRLTGSKIKDSLSRAVLAELKLNQKLVNNSIVLEQTPTGIAIRVDSTKGLGKLNKIHAIPIDRFQIQQTPRGVVTNIKRRRFIKSAFIATMPRTGKKGVFVRKFRGGKRVGRLPIRRIGFTTSIEMVAKAHLEKIVEDSQTTLLEVFKKELEKTLKKV
jgi:hypothetical protein